jgi:hypothetical protein
MCKTILEAFKIFENLKEVKIQQQQCRRYIVSTNFLHNVKKEWGGARRTSSQHHGSC